MPIAVTFKPCRAFRNKKHNLWKVVQVVVSFTHFFAIAFVCRVARHCAIRHSCQGS
jgi:hypothetical protein